ncbi:aldo/keto reductase [Pseudonocardia sp. KRD291]|uniref:aldo/keto reductase n=1 Tax=Pseudonocardia sp. KRD291 TaxID=2792007 RepID=UPI001C49D1C5|nr:aldo/keto reductase [Pseudonocardia sp. KRD291]MBW0106425.1 aldo/keto reductase [Pseudonocardia sp. KRD291]
MTTIGDTDLDVSGLCLGTNVFGWTADAEQSFALLDAYAEAGGNFLDSADSYMAGAEGNSGGESETIIGDWMAARGNRDRMVVATKVGNLPGRRGLSPTNLTAAVDDSLRRLRTDRIDLYYAHTDDTDTPQEDYLAAFDGLVRAGKVRALGASNFDADRLRSALEISGRDGLARFEAVQPHYNLVERGYEEDQALLVQKEGLSCFPYFGLAKGFLTGKYRPGSDGRVDSGATEGAMGWARAGGAKAYLDERGVRVLGVLDEVAAAHDVPVASVALAWLSAQPTVVAPIASARTLDQLAQILPSTGLALAPDELAGLSRASESR